MHQQATALNVDAHLDEEIRGSNALGRAEPEQRYQ